MWLELLAEMIQTWLRRACQTAARAAAAAVEAAACAVGHATAEALLLLPQALLRSSGANGYLGPQAVALARRHWAAVRGWAVAAPNSAAGGHRRQCAVDRRCSAATQRSPGPPKNRGVLRVGAAAHLVLAPSALANQ